MKSVHDVLRRHLLDEAFFYFDGPSRKWMTKQKEKSKKKNIFGKTWSTYWNHYHSMLNDHEIEHTYGIA